MSSQAAFIEERFYSATTGQLTKTSATGSAPTLYVYNTLGQLTRSGLDVDNGGALVLASNDRITDADTTFESYSSAWWLKTTTTAYPVASSSTAVTSSLSRQRLTGFTSGRLSETQATDAEGNTTTSTTDLSGKLITTTTTVPGITNPRTEMAYNGLSSSATGHDSLTTKLQYDALGRPWKTTDARSLVTTTAYVTNTARVYTTTDSASAVVSTLGYTTAGRTDWTQDAKGNVTRFAFNLRGQPTNQWGSGTIPVSYSYDATYGDRTGMSTYRGAPAADYISWPSSAVGTADTTTWNIDTASGLLWKKTDAAGKYVAFNYNSRGQTTTRTWARGTTTTYGYDSATGELTGQTYSDSTPAVSFTYTRLGQTDAVTDFTGARDYVYDSAKPWRLQNETLSSDFGSVSFTARYDTSGLVGRYAGFKLGSSPASSSIVEQDYAYTAAGRFDALTSQRASNSVSAGFQYGYLTNTALVNGYTTGSNFTVARAYESNRDVLASIDSKWSTTSLTKYEFTTNALYQRQTAKQSGTAFTDYYASGYTSVFNQYSYNGRGELETAAMYRGDTTPAVNAAPSATDELPGRRFEYRYDGAGNRQNAGPTGSPANIDEQYTTNALNQYTVKENNTVRVTGTAAANAKVAVAGTTIVNKRDRVWSTELFPSNASTAAAGNVTVYTAPVAADRIKTDSSKTFFIPKAVQTFSYDDDGNMTADSVWDYTYDAENRLVAMQHRSEVIGSSMITTTNARRLEFKYDYLGRRVAKIVKGGWNGSSYPTTLSHAKFLYDGWNPVAEYTGATSTTLGTLLRAYTWGLDLAGSLTATGGVGALLQLYDAGTTKTYLPTYDGNGNVVSMVNASSGALEAVYEYSPFGEPIRSEGAYATTNPIRFSSKYTDQESGLSYYGHRYYSATLGRFINRDPIEQAGGLNLYGFCVNNGVDRYDYLGHDPENAAFNSEAANGWSVWTFTGQPGTNWIQTSSTSWKDNATQKIWYLDPGSYSQDFTDAVDFDMVPGIYGNWQADVAAEEAFHRNLETFIRVNTPDAPLSSSGQDKFVVKVGKPTVVKLDDSAPNNLDLDLSSIGKGPLLAANSTTGLGSGPTSSPGFKPNTGDLIVYRDNNVVQKAVGAITPGGPGGHVGIVLYGGTVLTARPGDGVTIDRTISVKSGSTYDVYRPTGTFDPHALVQTGLAAIGKGAGYDYTFLVGFPTSGDTSFTCAAIVAAAYHNAGVPVGANWVATPNNITTNTSFTKVYSSDQKGP